MALLVVMGVTGGEENAVTIGFLVLTAIFVMLPWDAYRCSVVLRRGHELPELRFVGGGGTTRREPFVTLTGGGGVGADGVMLSTKQDAL